MQIPVAALALVALLFPSPARADDQPTDPVLWQRLETLDPTPKGTGFVSALESGQMQQFRFAVPRALPGRYLVSLNNIVAMDGTGTSYQVEIHVDSPDGPLLYVGQRASRGQDFNLEDLSRLDATEFITREHRRQGYVDIWATVHVEGDTWTTYRDSDGEPRDIYALAPDAEAVARRESDRAQETEMLRAGVSVIPCPQRVVLRGGAFDLSREVRVSVAGSDEDDATAEYLRGELSALLKQSVLLGSGDQRGEIRLERVPIAEPGRLALPPKASPGSVLVSGCTWAN